jgi:Co/Zn/Cd efflux system component
MGSRYFREIFCYTELFNTKKIQPQVNYQNLSQMNDSVSEQTAIQTTYFSIVGNTLLALLKGIAGFFGNSYALISDAIESTTDVFSSILVLFGFIWFKICE